MANIQKVVEILKENKVAEQAIAVFIENLNNLHAQKIQTELISILDDEKDMARINALPEDQMQGELAALYKQKTGKDIGIVSDEILDGFVTGFLTEYHQQKLAEKKS